MIPKIGKTYQIMFESELCNQTPFKGNGTCLSIITHDNNGRLLEETLYEIEYINCNGGLSTNLFTGKQIVKEVS